MSEISPLLFSCSELYKNISFFPCPVLVYPLPTGSMCISVPKFSILRLHLARREASFFLQYSLHPVMVQVCQFLASKNHFYLAPSCVFFLSSGPFLLSPFNQTFYLPFFSEILDGTPPRRGRGGFLKYLLLCYVVQSFTKTSLFPVPGLSSAY